MNFGGCRPTFSKLKYFSGALQCHFSHLRSEVRSIHVFKGLIELQPSRRTFNTSCKALTEGNDRCYSGSVAANSPFMNVNVESIAKGEKELMKKLNVIVLEVEVMRQEGLRVPSKMTDERWSELLQLPTRSQRLKQLAFWWLNEIKKEKDKKRKEARLKSQASQVESDEKKNTDHIFYGFGGSTIFIRIYDSAIDHFYNSRLVQSMLFGQNVVIDCSYDKHMTPKEAALCAKQLQLVFADNRQHQDPFNIHFCNVNKEGQVFTKLHKGISTMYDDAFPMNINENSFMDMFPQEQLVYLTPHCREDLKKYNYDDIYIIGAMVDKANAEPLSLGKAKSLGLRMARLPLDRYLDWGVGNKSLTINQMLLILLELKSSQDWNKALKHVPKRKLRNDFEYFDRNRTKFRRDLRFP